MTQSERVRGEGVREIFWRRNDEYSMRKTEVSNERLKKKENIMKTDRRNT